VAAGSAEGAGCGLARHRCRPRLPVWGARSVFVCGVGWCAQLLVLPCGACRDGLRASGTFVKPSVISFGILFWFLVWLWCCSTVRCVLLAPAGWCFIGCQVSAPFVLLL
jgi:hypothetical protein